MTWQEDEEERKISEAIAESTRHIPVKEVPPEYTNASLRKLLREAHVALADEVIHADTMFDALSDLLDLHEDEPSRPAVAYGLGVWNDHKLRRKELP